MFWVGKWGLTEFSYRGMTTKKKARLRAAGLESTETIFRS
jgi:hypothetical protein